MWEKELVGKLRQIRLRLRMLVFYNNFLTWAFWAAVAALVFAGASRLAPTGPVTLWHVLGALGGVCLLATTLWALLRPLNLFQTAVHADVHLGLRERLSTAYVFMRDQREIVEEVRRDALEASRGIQPRRDFRPHVRPHAKFAWLPLLLAALIWQFVPQFDLFASRAAENAKTLDPLVAQNDAVVKELEKIQQKIEKAPVEKKDATEKLDELKKDIDKLVQEMQQQPTVKPQEAMAKISTMQERLEEQRKQLQDKLDASQMTKPLSKTGEAREMAEALKKGDMEAAQKALQQMMEKMQKGEMSQQEMERAAQQLEQMAQEMKDAGEMSEQMEQLSKELSQACKNCQGGKLSAEDMKNLSKSAGQLSQEMLDMKEAIDQLNKMAEMEKKLGQCKSACKGGQGDPSVLGNGSGNNRDKIGPGMGGEGIGQGNPAPFSEEDVAFQEDKLEGKKGEGEIISSMKVPQLGEGEMPGASKVAPQSITADYRREVETSMDKEAIPASHREAVRRYYDSLNPASGTGSNSSAPNSGSTTVPK